VVREGVGGESGGFAVECKEQDAGGGFVQAVYGVDVLTDVVADQGQGDAGFMAVDAGAVYEHAGGLMYGNQVSVLVEDGNWFALRGFTGYHRSHGRRLQKSD